MKTDVRPLSTLRRLRVGDLVKPELVEHRARRLDATAIILPGTSDLAAYLDTLNAAEADFAAWDGRVLVLERDGAPSHRALVVDRYGQVYGVVDTDEAGGLLDVAALEEWFRFLATACPECGVLDEPIGRGWVP